MKDVIRRTARNLAIVLLTLYLVNQITNSNILAYPGLILTVGTICASVYICMAAHYKNSASKYASFIALLSGITVLNYAIDPTKLSMLNIIVCVFTVTFYLWKNKTETVPVINIVTDNSAWKKATKAILPIILIFAALGLLWNAVHANFDLDEGIHSYDAKLITEGKVPFRDYLTREPVYIYALASVQKIFGDEILVARLFSVFFAICAICLVAAISYSASAKATVISILLICLTPILGYYAYLGNLYPLFYAWLLFTIYCYQKLVHTPSKSVWLLVLLGGLLGLGTHTYRIMLFIALVTIVLLSARDKLKFKQKIGFASVYLSTTLTPIIIFSLLAGYHQLDVMYGSTQIIIGSMINAGLLFVPARLFERTQRIFAQNMPVALIGSSAAIVIFCTIGTNVDLKARVLTQALVLSSPIVIISIPTIIGIINSTCSRINGLIYKSLLATATIILVSRGLTSYTTLKNYGLRELTIIEIAIAVLIVSAATYLIIKSNSQELNNASIDADLLLISISPLIFYAMHVQLFVTTLVITSIIIIPLAAKSISHCRNLGILAIILIISSAIIVSEPTQDRPLSVGTYNEIVNLVLTSDANNDILITSAPIFAVGTGKSMILDNSRPTVYIIDNKDNLSMPSYVNLTRSIPSIDEFVNHIERNGESTIIIDTRFKRILSNNPRIAKTIRDRNDTTHKVEGYEVKIPVSP